jgi:AcrR family transcriptional regulator
MAKINLERRAEIGREKRARTKAQLIAGARTLFAKRPWESVTVDEVVNEAGVAKGTFYGHFNDLGELAAAVADELVHSFDELIQPQRLSISDPVARIAFGCGAFLKKAMEDRSWASLVARMARSYPPVGQVARRRLSEDLREAFKQSQIGLSPELALEVAIGVVLQVVAAIGEGRLEDRDRPEAVRTILTAIGVGKRDAASIVGRIECARKTAIRSAFKNAQDARAAPHGKSPAALRRANAMRA